jgi:hypothetical protein
MKSTRDPWTASSVLALLFGVALVLMGLYFALLRPPLLPEDLRYIGASQAQIETIAPRLTLWLTQVFRVMGGFIAATGALTITLAATSFRTHQRAAEAATFVSGLASIGWMTAINFMIDSDFKWALFAIAALWLASLALFEIENRALQGR